MLTLYTLPQSLAGTLRLHQLPAVAGAGLGVKGEEGGEARPAYVPVPA